MPELAAELIPVMDQSGADWEWLILDDHSNDGTFAFALGLSRQDDRVRCVRMAKNYGSHALCLYGFQQVHGDYAVLLSADLQDPPAMIPRLVAEAKSGANVVWLTRTKRADPLIKTLVAQVYYFTLKHLLRIGNIPQGGSDMVLVDGRVLKELAHLHGPHINLLTAIAQLGFKQMQIPGERRARLHGRSNFTFVKNLKLLFDTVTAHSYAPMRWMSGLGFCTVTVSMFYAVHVVITKLRGLPVEGWTSLMLAILFIGGVQMLMLGIYGEYLWRTLEITRNRPQNLVEDSSNNWDEDE